MEMQLFHNDFSCKSLKAFAERDGKCTVKRPLGSRTMLQLTFSLLLDVLFQAQNMQSGTAPLSYCAAFLHNGWLVARLPQLLRNLVAKYVYWSYRAVNRNLYF
jgi:hypothetical protein